MEDYLDIEDEEDKLENMAEEIGYSIEVHTHDLDDMNESYNEDCEGDTIHLFRDENGEYFHVKKRPGLGISVPLNITMTHTITNCGFGDLSQEVINTILKDGRPFSYFIELWLEKQYPLTHVKGCKSFDFTDGNFPDTLYDAKTFTKNECSFTPSNMKGQGRKFDLDVFTEKTKKLIFIIVSNVNFPEIKVKFMRGTDLLTLYPKGKIPSKDRVKFFN